MTDTKINIPEYLTGNHANSLFAGQWGDEAVLRSVSEANRNGTYLDCGAGIGNHSLFFALRCPSTLVYSFVTDPVDFEMLSDLAAANDLLGKIIPTPYLPFDMEGAVSSYSAEAGFALETQSLILDAYITDPVAVMRLGLGDLNLKVIAGACRIIRENAPVIVVDEATDDLQASLSAEGYGPIHPNIFQMQR